MLILSFVRYSQYAAVAADTFSSELGILSSSKPRLITSPTLRQVPPGTNGGVTLLGIGAGLLGSFVTALTSVALLPFCPVVETTLGVSALRPGFQGGHAWGLWERVAWVAFVTVWGGLGSLLDSFLGAWLQASVVDVRTGKVVEGRGGKMVSLEIHRGPYIGVSGSSIAQVPVTDPKSEKDGRSSSRKVEAGRAILDNNGVNLAMAAIMSFGGMAVASWAWNVPIRSALPW